MSRPLLADGWYRMRLLRPRLRSQVRVHRHTYRGEVWYVLEDPVGAKHQRFNAQAYRVIDLLDGERTMEEIWQLLVRDLHDETPTQDDILRLLAALHAADLIQADIPPDTAEQLDRRRKQVRRKWLARAGNPIAIRIPLWDPDRFLSACVESLRPAARWIAGLCVLLVVGALLLVPSHWGELTQTTRDQWLATDNLFMLFVLFPVVKILHELGHGLACKAYGGEVHETGVMLLIFYPVPYVDASASSAFPDKWHRMLVGAAGMLAEFWVAALAFFAWLLLEPGVARGVALNVMLLASITTILFNANPLLRFDGYYILADWLEIPNLAQRANKQWQYFAERFLFGVRNAQPPVATQGERRWFVVYAPVSYVYRIVISIGIALFVATQAFVLGVLMAIWSIGQSVLWPVVKGVRALATGPQFAGRTARIRAVLGTGLLLLIVLLFVLPVPHSTIVTGVLWLPERAIVRTSASGFVQQLIAHDGRPVQAGDAVAALHDPALAARLQVQRAKVEEVRVQMDAQWGVSQSRVQQLEQQLRLEQTALDRLEDEWTRLTARAGLDGILLVPNAADLSGRFQKAGDVLAYVRVPGEPVVRVAVGHDAVDLVRESTRSVQVRHVHDAGFIWEARLLRSVPSAVRELPSAALGTRAGGEFVTDPRDEKGLSLLESVFEFELALPQDAALPTLGSRVHVRFVHPAEPIAWRVGRALRRAFLSRFLA